MRPLVLNPRSRVLLARDVDFCFLSRAEADVLRVLLLTARDDGEYLECLDRLPGGEAASETLNGLERAGLVKAMSAAPSAARGHLQLTVIKGVYASAVERHIVEAALPNSARAVLQAWVAWLGAAPQNLLMRVAAPGWGSSAVFAALPSDRREALTDEVSRRLWPGPVPEAKLVRALKELLAIGILALDWKAYSLPGEVRGDGAWAVSAFVSLRLPALGVSEPEPNEGAGVAAPVATEASSLSAERVRALMSGVANSANPWTYEQRCVLLKLLDSPEGVRVVPATSVHRDLSPSPGALVRLGRALRLSGREAHEAVLELIEQGAIVKAPAEDSGQTALRVDCDILERTLAQHTPAAMRAS